MKAEIHPEYHTINIVMTDGEKFQTKSCYGKEGDTLTLDIDIKNHPAWQKDGGQFINTKNDQISKFNKKFGDFSFGAKKEEA